MFLQTNNSSNMKTENTYKWMVWIIVILALMNIATIVTVIYNRNKANSEVTVESARQSQSPVLPMKYSGRYFRDQLGFNNDQMSRFVEFNPAFRENVKNINIELDLLRDQMLSEMAAEKCDSIKLGLLSDSIGYLHANLKKVTYEYYLDIKNICDKQQQEKLKELFSGMFASDFRKGRYGRGSQQGRQHGRQFNN